MSHERTLDVAGRTRAGRTRAENQDAFASFPDVGLCVVADGMGGSAGGGLAAGLAVAATAHALRTGGGPAGDAGRLAAAVEHAHLRVRAAAQAGAEVARMGTTLAAVLAGPRRLVAAHVGDSRIYRACDGRLERLTRDHSVAADLVFRGLVGPDQIRGGPFDGVLARCLGREERVDVDVCTVGVVEGDAALLCTDGLWRVVGEDEMAAALGAGRSAAEVAERLVGLVAARGGEDDATVVVVRWGR